MQEELERELKELLVRALMLDYVKPEEIVTEAPLFGEGLGLDSIDALEIALVLNQTYGLKLSAEDDKNRSIFHSIRSLATFIHAHRTNSPTS
jgi:acyl carrier protein